VWATRRIVAARSVRRCGAGGIRVTIPLKLNERRTTPFDRISYCQRNKLERLVNRDKQFHRLARCDERRAANDQAMWLIAAVVLWLDFANTPESGLGLGLSVDAAHLMVGSSSTRHHLKAVSRAVRSARHTSASRQVQSPSRLAQSASSWGCVSWRLEHRLRLADSAVRPMCSATTATCAKPISAMVLTSDRNPVHDESGWQQGRMSSSLHSEDAALMFVGDHASTTPPSRGIFPAGALVIAMQGRGEDI